MLSEYLPAFTEADKTMLLVGLVTISNSLPLGKIERLEYTDTFLSIRTSEVGTMQIKILPLCKQNSCDSSY